MTTDTTHRPTAAETLETAFACAIARHDCGEIGDLLHPDCIGGAMQRDVYRTAIEAACFTITDWQVNDQYRSVSDLTDNATQKYGVTSISMRAVKA